MSAQQWCLCAAQMGYPHAIDCPRPMYRGSEPEELLWRAQRDRIRAFQMTIRLMASTLSIENDQPPRGPTPAPN